MTSLFVDCDDTLALFCWKPEEPRCPHGNIHPYGSKHSPWDANTRLLEGIRAFRAANPEADIVIWSGGGREYAQTFIDTLLPDIKAISWDKIKPWIQAMVQEGDIVVDDQPIVSKGTHFYPHEWPPRLYDDVDEETTEKALRQATRRALKADDYETAP